jgi:sulfate adenylyltransferase
MEPASEHPRVILNDDEIDHLELCLRGYLPPSTHPRIEPLIACELLDQEGTSVARWNGTELTELRPLAVGAGPVWSPRLRMSAAEASRHEMTTVMVPLDAPIATAQLLHAADEALKLQVDADSAGALTRRVRLLITVLTSRRAAPRGVISGRTLLDLAEEARSIVESTKPALQCEVLVLPWPRTHPPSLQSVAAALGAMLAGIDTHVDDESAVEFPPRASAALRAARNPEEHGGAVILFTGLSGSGKSTISRALAAALHDLHRQTELLDGDALRRRVSQHLGFDRASRIQNVINIARVATEAAVGGAIAIAAPIAPFHEARAAAREIAARTVPFMLIYISTPLEVCEARDRKGLYARARAGEIADFTGISSPYEPPVDADLTIDASNVPLEESVDQILALLRERKVFKAQA